MKTLAILLFAFAAAAAHGSRVDARDPDSKADISTMTEAQLRLEIRRGEIKMTIVALDEGLAAVALVAKNLDAQFEAFGKDPKLRETILRNMRIAIEWDAQLRQVQGIWKRELEALEKESVK